MQPMPSVTRPVGRVVRCGQPASVASLAANFAHFLRFLGGIAGGLPDDRKASAVEIAAAMSSGTAALQELGKCELEDKTMYDAIKPFADDLSARVAAGESLGDAWAAAANLATEKAAATADLMPKLGRARPLGEKSLGTPDPGATSMAELLTAVGPIFTPHATP